MKYLEYYKEHIETGLMNQAGLCMDLNYSVKLDLFKPTVQNRLEFEVHKSDFGRECDYWGSGDKTMRSYEFTPLRQNIVLFLAAINNEL